ncbi:E3 SUMO-protein ligase MMS21-like isoform X1 [Mangifera indica]|uniref:E3 SUMO-protein ligase MMS21-like isoform X1 n=2 Tax=Mangifera indica TaxID=29780 RepID=UPI001CFA908B|nr:E3 SUMO-protein ligase MMS21-like isoform X1 [Mangifera indica]
MASTSGSRHDGLTERIRNATTTLYSENNSLLGEIRKAMSLMKEVAVDLERDNQSQMVKKLEDAAMQLSEAYGDCTHYSSSIESIGNLYEPGTELTDFKKLLEGELVKSKTASSSFPQKESLMRQFREAVWNVHHAGEPMPGEEQEDVIMTSTQCNLLNFTCPLSGKPVTELADPVRSVECKHIYERDAILAYIKSKNKNGRCPVAGCPKILKAAKVVCDPLLQVEIEEMRSMNNRNARPNVIEDCTGLDEEENA